MHCDELGTLYNLWILDDMTLYHDHYCVVVSLYAYGFTVADKTYCKCTLQTEYSAEYLTFRMQSVFSITFVWSKHYHERTPVFSEGCFWSCEKLPNTEQRKQGFKWGNTPEQRGCSWGMLRERLGRKTPWGRSHSACNSLHEAGKPYLPSWAQVASQGQGELARGIVARMFVF